MKFYKSLPFRLLLGIVLGIILGLFLPENAMVVVVTVKYVLGQLITFCVPLIIIGFIAPSITRLGNSATRMLSVAVAIAYVSSVLAAFMSMGAGYAIIPHLSIVTDPESLRFFLSWLELLQSGQKRVRLLQYWRNFSRLS